MKTIYIIISSALFFGLSPAHAYDLTTTPYLFGDWGGARTALEDEGVKFKFAYGGEVAHNATGGTEIKTAYTDQWVLGATLDSEKLGFWKGGTFQFTETYRNGDNLGADAGIGNDQLIQEVYGRGQTWHLTQFWINQKFFDDKLEWKIGRLTFGEDFAAFSCDFQNLTFCGSQPGNLVGSYWLNWPTSVWATRLKLHTGEETAWQLGVYEVNPNYVMDAYAQKYGWTLDEPGGSTGAVIPVEFDWSPKFSGQPGWYKFGVWYNTAKGQEVSNPAAYGAQFGGYINFEQQITGTDTVRGLSVFLNATQADALTAQTDRQISLGMQYHDPFERLDDMIGFAVGATDNNSAYANYIRATAPGTIIGDGNEYVAEVYYSYAPIHALFLRPNLQYILDPGGTSDNKNAFVLGLKEGVVF